MNLSQEYEAYKQIHFEGDTYQFVVDLAETKFRWFEIDISSLSYLVEVQAGGTIWKIVLLTKGTTSVVLGSISQLYIIHGTPIEQSAFTAALESAILKLTNN